MSTILNPSNILHETKRLFGKLRHRRMTLGGFGESAFFHGRPVDPDHQLLYF